MIARRDTETELPEVGRFLPPASVPKPPRTDALQMVWRQRWVVLLTTLVCLGAGFAYMVRATPIYSSSSRLYVQQSGPRIISESSEYMSEAHNYLYTQCELIKATPVMTAVADLPETRRMKTFDHIDNIAGVLRGKLTAEVDKTNDIITVSFESPYPAEASSIVNSTVNAYVDSQSLRKKNSAAEVLKILATQKNKSDAELSEMHTKMAAFKTAHPNLSFQSGDQKGNIVTESLARLSEALTTARLQTIEAKTTYQLLSEHHGEGQAKFGSAELSTLRAKLRDLEDQLETSLHDLGPGNKQIAQLNTQIGRTQKEIAEEEAVSTDSGLAAIRQQWDIAVAKEKEIQEQVDAEKKGAVDLNTEAAEYGLLEGELQRVEKLTDIIDSRIKELNITEDVGALNISVLDVARPGGGPVKPEKSRIMGMALLFGLMLGVGLGILRESMDQRLQASAEEVAASIGMPVIGVVPHMPGEYSIIDRGQTVHKEPMSEIAESYRTIRTAVFFGMPTEAKTILITSPCPGDGKTTSASNLAIALAQAGYRTLLLDADFRKPTQHKIFELDDSKGVCSVISREHKLRDVISRTAIEGLHVLPCGPIPNNPAEILHGKAFGKIVEVLCAAYDRIVFDSAPIVPVADGRILAAVCDITLLVLRAERSTLKLSTQARESLESVGATLPGIILNDMPRKKYGYGYYNGYYTYRHGANGEKNGKHQVKVLAPITADVPDNGNGIMDDAPASPPVN